MSRRPSIAIVGAGVGGMAAASLLGRAGHGRPRQAAAAGRPGAVAQATDHDE